MEFLKSGGSYMRSLRCIGWLMAIGACLGQSALSAQETSQQDGQRRGGFGAPVVKFTEIDGKFGVLVGGRGGWIINDSFVLGAGGYGLANRNNFEDFMNTLGDRGRLSLAYGGVEFEYVYRPREVVHFSAAVLIGAGGLVWDPQDPPDDREDDGFFIAEPALNLLFNVTKSFRAGLGVSYRFVQDVELFDLRDRDISGLAGVVTLKFGRF